MNEIEYQKYQHSHISQTLPLVQWGERVQLISDGLLQRALSIPSELAMMASINPWVEQQLLYPRYQKRLLAHQSTVQRIEEEMNSADRAILKSLRQDGICVTSLADLNLSLNDEFWSSAHCVAAELAHLATMPKYATKHTLTGAAHQLMRYPSIFWWGAQERLLNIVEAYLGLPAAYDSLSFYYSLADGRDAGPRKYKDTSLCK